MTEEQLNNYKKRWNEIQFICYYNKLNKLYGGSYLVHDLLTIHCNLAGVDDLGNIKILKIINETKEGRGLTAYTDEIVVISRALDISYRKVQDITNVSIATQYRHWSVLKNKLQNYTDLVPILSEEDYNIVMTLFKSMIEKGAETLQWLKLI